MTEIDKGIARLRADFNSVRDGLTLVATFPLDVAYALPGVGEIVEIYDPEGNTCMGRVVDILGDDTFRIRLAYETWQDAPDVSEKQIVDLMEALRQSVAEAQTRAQERGVKTGPEREEVDDFTVSAA